eukprot:5969526-Pyramimonas_sp.AAC.1
MGPSVCPLQVLQRNTAVVLKQALMQTSSVGPGAQQFVQKSRVVCSDRASANLLTERMIAHDRGDDWSTLFCPCEVHMSSGCFEK